MARNAPREGELPEQPAETSLVERHLRIDFAVAALEPGIGNHARPAVSGAADIDHVEVTLTNDPVEMGIDEIEARRGAPVSQEPRFDMLRLQRLAQQRIVEEVYLPHRYVIGGAPVAIDERQLIGPKGVFTSWFHGSLRPFAVHQGRDRARGSGPIPIPMVPLM
ncbi:hypothetical protein D3C72_1563440 [compost metagenome]